MHQFIEYFKSFTSTPGKISYKIILDAFRGKFSSVRYNVVEKAFAKLSDESRKEIVSIDTLCDQYDVSLLPDYKDGSKTEADVIKDFKRQLFPKYSLSKDDFMDYYR